MTDVLDTDNVETGQVLDGRYRLIERIGEGGMARVYRAEDTVLGRTVAVKVLRGGIADADSIARARSETALLAALNHHSLVTLFDATISDESGGYLVMEHVDGMTLRELIARGPIDPAALAAIALDLAEGLHVAHQAGIVHRDIKPSNVLMWRSPIPGREWRAKLADFGIACLLDSARITTPGLVIGTMAYIAPEQAQGAVPAPPADIYAFGIMLIEALTGHRPFAEAEGIGAVTARLVAPAPIPDDVSPQWQNLLRGMTAREPGDRPTALEVAVAAGALIATETAARTTAVDEPTVEMAPLAPPPLPPAEATGATVAFTPAMAASVPPAAEPEPAASEPPPAAPDETEVVPVDPPARMRDGRARTAAPVDPERRAADRRNRILLLVLLAAVVIAIATIIAVWSASLTNLPLPTPSPTLFEEQAPQPSAPAEETPAPVEEQPVQDDGGGDQGGDTGNGNSGNGGGNGNDNSGPGNNNGNGNGGGNGNG